MILLPELEAYLQKKYKLSPAEAKPLAQVMISKVNAPDAKWNLQVRIRELERELAECKEHLIAIIKLTKEQ